MVKATKGAYAWQTAKRIKYRSTTKAVTGAFESQVSLSITPPSPVVPLTSCYHDSAPIQRQPLIWQRTKQQTDVGIVMQSVPSLAPSLLLLLRPPPFPRQEKQQPALALHFVARTCTCAVTIKLNLISSASNTSTKEQKAGRRRCCWSSEKGCDGQLALCSHGCGRGQGWLRDAEVKPALNISRACWRVGKEAANVVVCSGIFVLEGLLLLWVVLF